MRRAFIVLAGMGVLCAGAASADAGPAARKAELDRLLTALKAAPNEQAAGILEVRIRQLWTEAGGPAATLLMNKGARNLQDNAEDEAIDDFDAALALSPGLPEAYVRRAMARFGAGDYAGAVADISQALTLEPRHFGALQALSHIAEAHGDWQGALSAWQKSLEIDPNTPGGQDRLKLLTTKAEGEGI